MIVVIALAASAVYGAADFFGGLATRRNPAAVVVLLSQVAGVAVLAVAMLLVPGPFAPGDVPVGILGGFVAATAIVALYGALAVGRMGVVSPITAVVGASVPVIVGYARGDRVGLWAGLGIGCALVAIILVTADPKTRRLSLAEPGLGLALLSGLAIGALYIVLGGSPQGGFGRLAVIRAVSLGLLGVYCLVRRESLRPAVGSLRTIVAAGALDMGANVLYVLAAGRGALAIAAVLTSLYPASTVLLARIVLHERLNALQWAGVACAIAGVVLIAR